MKKQMLIPSGISALRLTALPLFLYFFFNGNTAMAMVVFASAAMTDLFDGFFARKLGAVSKFGAYFDAATDFILVLGIFAAFTISSYYPQWMLLLIAFSFAQFLTSSLYTKKLHDPLGKYIGSVLYIAIALSLLFPSTFIFNFVQIGFSLFAITSFVTRTASFTTTYRKTILNQKIDLKHPNAQTA
jgi:phosphatidylglycerophosphate synthase